MITQALVKAHERNIIISERKLLSEVFANFGFGKRSFNNAIAMLEIQGILTRTKNVENTDDYDLVWTGKIGNLISDGRD